MDLTQPIGLRIKVSWKILERWKVQKAEGRFSRLQRSTNLKINMRKLKQNKNNKRLKRRIIVENIYKSFK